MASASESSRRKRRGHSAASPASEAPDHTNDDANDDAGDATSGGLRVSKRHAPKIDPRAYQQVMAQVRAFSEQRFEQLITSVAQGFFGMASREEVQLPELRSAFFAFFVLGYRDQNRIRVLDMFRGYGFKPDANQQRVLDALSAATFRVVEITHRHEGNRQFDGRDILTQESLRFVDKKAFDTLIVGDAIMAWFMPSGEVFRPVEVATQIEALRLPGITAALRSLAESSKMKPHELLSRNPAQAFWTVYRGVNVLR